MRRLLVVLVGLLLAWVGLANAAEASAVVPSLHGTSYTYGAPSYDTPENYTAPERGPPVKGHVDTPVDLRWHGALAIQSRAATSAIYDYDAPALTAQVDSAAGMTSESAGQHEGDLSSFQRWQVAAKSGPRLGATLRALSGREIKIGKNVRIAPLGNRTGHPTGRYPHDHRRGVDKDGVTRPGQGIGRLRPWDKKSADKASGTISDV